MILTKEQEDLLNEGHVYYTTFWKLYNPCAYITYIEMDGKDKNTVMIDKDNINEIYSHGTLRDVYLRNIVQELERLGIDIQELIVRQEEMMKQRAYFAGKAIE